MNASPSKIEIAEHSDTLSASIADVEAPGLSERKRKLRKVVLGVMGGALLLLCTAGISAAVRTSDEIPIATKSLVANPAAPAKPPSADVAIPGASTQTKPVNALTSTTADSNADTSAKVAPQPVARSRAKRPRTTRYVSAALRSKMPSTISTSTKRTTKSTARSSTKR